MKETRVIIGILLAAALVFAISMWTSRDIAKIGVSGAPPPWKITVNKDGTSEALGVTLGKTTLGDAEKLFGEESEISLFTTETGDMSLEGYFEKISAGGFSGGLVVIVEADVDWMKRVRSSAVRPKQMPSGAVQINLDVKERETARQSVAVGITYVPSINLDEQMVAGRFGEPAKKMKVDDQTEHWLYPALGLSITLNKKSKESLQYVRPADFDKLVDSLTKSGQNAETPR